MMETVSALLPLLHLPQACLSAYTIYLSSIVVPKLQRYEEKSEKAAEWSNTAEHQLHKTRTTQTSGALTVGRQILLSPTAGVVSFSSRFFVILPIYSSAGLLSITAGVLLLLWQFPLAGRRPAKITNLVSVRPCSHFLHHSL